MVIVTNNLTDNTIKEPSREIFSSLLNMYLENKILKEEEFGNIKGDLSPKIQRLLGKNNYKNTKNLTDMIFEKIEEMEDIELTPISFYFLMRDFAFNGKYLKKENIEVNMELEILFSEVEKVLQSFSPFVLNKELDLFLEMYGHILEPEDISKINKIHKKVEKLVTTSEDDFNFYISDFQIGHVFWLRKKISDLIEKSEDKSTESFFYKIIESLDTFGIVLNKEYSFKKEDNEVIFEPKQGRKEIQSKFKEYLQKVAKGLIPEEKKTYKSIEEKPFKIISERILNDNFTDFKMLKDRQKIALLIDSDNAPAAGIDEVLKELAAYGAVSIKRAYGNWTKPTLQKWTQKLHDYSIVPVQQFDLSTGKNATDIAMSIDAIELCYTKDIHAFALMTSDSDFTPLSSKLLSNGFTVFGFGERKTPKPFISSCSMFFYIDSLTQTEEKRKIDKETIDLLKKAIVLGANEEGWALASKIGLYITNNSSFSHKNFGYDTLSEMLRKIEGVEGDVWQGENGGRINVFRVKRGIK